LKIKRSLFFQDFERDLGAENKKKLVFPRL
jgi:hypothetical protein